MEMPLIVCLYLIIGCFIVFWKTKEIEALVGIYCAFSEAKQTTYYLLLFLAKIILVLLFPFALLLK